jgi:hypothetical protein
VGKLAILPNGANSQLAKRFKLLANRHIYFFKPIGADWLPIGIGGIFQRANWQNSVSSGQKYH